VGVEQSECGRKAQATWELTTRKNAMIAASLVVIL
jgi:hypothetical protein